MIHAVILAGGWGRRFWPKSRRKFPKQLLSLGARRSSIQRLYNIIKLKVPNSRIWVVVNKKYVSGMREQLPDVPKRNFLVEPAAKNTAAAIGWASFVIKGVDPEATTMVLSSDHIIKQKRLFLSTLKQACEAARRNILVTIGIKPWRAAEEFGYLKIVHSSWFIVHSKKLYKVKKFVEKPPLKKAQQFLKAKNYLWNSGIFIWRADVVLKAIKKYMPELHRGLKKIDKARRLPSYKHRLAEEYNKFRDLSIDYGVMEKADNIYALPGEFSWSDIGTWASLSHDYHLRDAHGNVVKGLYKGINTFDSVILSDKKHLVGVVGLKNVVVVHTPTATLVCNKEHAQDVKELTHILEQDKKFRKYL